MIQYKGKAGGSLADRTPTTPRLAEAAPCAADSACADFSVRGGSGLDAGRLDSWCASYEGGATPGGLFRDAHLSDPKLDSELADGVPVLPAVGGEFCGFKLVAELGRGAFGRVFLSHQGDLADRPVALKISTEIREESQRLARLQHTNIVPIYSFHRLGNLQAVCMPYFGSATLADVATELSRRDSLPASGKMVASTVYDRRSRTLRTADSGITPAPVRPAPPVAPTAERPTPAPAPLPAPATRDLKRLEGLTYVETILWIGARLADGLAHAHDRGILHRDLKPANVLLTDEGQPMLLDFNLSEDLGKGQGASVAQVGGTLPYMAPEHLEAFGGTWRDLDARCDVYSLGVILYELLTGRTPFTRRTGPSETILPEMIAERRQGAPRLRCYNKAVSPAAEAIVRKCLDPEPARRYQTAADLKEDLERHLDNLPLRHQPEPKFRERAAKWLRRHPRVRSTGAVTTLAAMLVAAAAWTAFGFYEHSENDRAVRRYAEFQQDGQAAQVLLYARVPERPYPGQEDEAREAARRALARYAVLEKEAWLEQAEVWRLPDADRERLPREVGQLLVLLAGSVVPDHGATPAQKAEALRLNKLAEACFDKEATPQALWAQRAELVTDPAEARRLRELAVRTPAREAWDHYLAARARMLTGKIPEAVAEAREAARLEPNSVAAWFLLGNCSQGSGSRNGTLEAIVHYTTCVSLRPDFYGSYFNRGLAYLGSDGADDQERLDNNTHAEADFVKVTRLRPDFAEAHLQLAQARERLGKYGEALADAGRALDAGAAPGRVYLVRARLRSQLGDRDGANRDLAAGLQETPTECRGWIDRGKARLEQGDAEKALVDFASAARCNPLSREAVQDQAYVVGEILKRPGEAIALLSRELELYPNQPVARAARGVYYAQAGNRAAAVADARRAVAAAPNDGGVLYRAACVFALTSRVAADPKADRRQAITYLAGALMHGFGFEYLEIDTDLAPLADEPGFAQLKKLAGQAQKLKG
jgi:serine/threonine protein kinase/predicted Zn-dependent protease